ncbi:MAG: hypothetical protein AAF199_03215, partial [Pseudomonadota bacterium]
MFGKKASAAAAEAPRAPKSPPKPEAKPKPAPKPKEAAGDASKDEKMPPRVVTPTPKQAPATEGAIVEVSG